MVAEGTPAIVLLSGGLDSATVLAHARSQGYACHALSAHYGQRHAAELNAAQALAQRYDCVTHRVVSIGLDTIGGSALTDSRIDVPQNPAEGIPVTYVPARNTVFLAVAMGLAETVDAADLFIGVNAVDYSGYPDCRPEFIEQFAKLSRVATRYGVETGEAMRIHTPLIDLSKAQIIAMGMALGVDYAQTVSCYQANDAGEACGRCDSCRLRAEGFAQAGVPDPTRYAKV